MCMVLDKLRQVDIRYDQHNWIEIDKSEIVIDNPKPIPIYLARLTVYFHIASIYTINKQLHICIIEL